jgi:hypothetical protein
MSKLDMLNLRLLELAYMQKLKQVVIKDLKIIRSLIIVKANNNKI